MADDNVSYIERLSRVDAMRLLSEIASDSVRVHQTTHATQQMNARGVTRKQVLEILKSCRFHEEPVWDTGNRDWKMTIESVSMGDWIRVSLGLKNKTDDDGESNFIIVITVIKLED